MTVTWNQCTKTGSWADPTVWNQGHVPTVDEGVKVTGNFIVAATAGSFPFRYIDIDGGTLNISYNAAMQGKDLAVDPADHTPAWHIRVRNTANSKLTGYQTYNGWSQLGSIENNPINRLNFMVETPSATSPIIDWMEESTAQRWFTLVPSHVSTFLGNDSTWVWFNQKGSALPFPKSLYLTSVSHPDRTPIIVTHTIEDRIGDKVYKNGEHSGTVQLDGVFQMTGRPDVDLKVLRDTNNLLAFISPYVTLNRCYVDSLKFKPGPGSSWVQFTMTLIEVI